uniref:Uncharacterized protein n=1 Tax=Anguilla anguilla TaxID=7936 RepID=A0A0E9XQ11_ANGAN
MVGRGFVNSQLNVYFYFKNQKLITKCMATLTLKMFCFLPHSAV